MTINSYYWTEELYHPAQTVTSKTINILLVILRKVTKKFIDENTTYETN